MATLVQDVRCTACRGRGVYMDLTVERSVVTVSARCYTCGHDQCVLGGAPRAQVETVDAVEDAAARLVRAVLG